MRMRRLVIPLLLLFLLFRPPPIETRQGNKIWVGPTDTDVSPRWATKYDFDGSFVFCRGYYKQSRYEEKVWGWYVDYPGADKNFLIRLAELTKIRIRRDADGNPVHVVVHLDSPLIFNCPVLFLSDAGTIGLTNSEIDNLRLYFEKGGFLWTDDFWGSQGWDHWEYQIRRILPSGLYPMIDISEIHPIRNQLFSIPKILQVPNIGFWHEKQQTSERGTDSKDVHFRGIEDERGRLIVVVTHNTDIGESWEREGFNPANEFFYKFSTFGYKLGINIFIYALTH